MNKLRFGLVLVVAAVTVGGLLFFWQASDTDTTSTESDSIRYETEVSDQSECTSYEQFDPEQEVCYYECADEQECADIEQAVNQEYEQLLASLEQRQGDISETQPDENTEFSARYTVGANETLTHTAGEDAQEFRTLWAKVAQLSPNSLSDQYIEEFVLYEDASDDTLAYVVDDDGNGKWQFGVNYATHSQSTKTEQTSTIIHELAHIITLNNSQVSPSTDNCNTYLTDEGCAAASSYLNTFVAKFWVEKTQSFDPNVFVTEYAATNPEEDLAESFAYFVISETTQPETTLIKNQKINFFSNYNELTTLREDMRSVITRSIVRERKTNN